MNLIETYKAEYTDNKLEVFEKGKGFVTRWTIEMRNGSLDVDEKEHRAYAGVEARIKKTGYAKC